MKLRKTTRRHNFESAFKSPMEDFLFILVISLAVAVNYFATQQLSDRFALAEKTTDAQQLPLETYRDLPVLEISENDGFQWQDQPLNALDEIHQHSQPISPNTYPAGILLRVSRDRSVGEMEDAKSLFLERGVKVFTEWEK